MAEPNELSERFQSLAIDTPDCVPFRPADSSRWKNVKLGDVPRYLFRVYTPRSDGSMDKVWAKSRDAAGGLTSAKVDVFRRDNRNSASYELTAHLNWYRKSRNDNFISWTSSLLFAIQYMFFRHRMPEDSSPEDEIMLCIIDTTEFETDVFARDMDLIIPFATDDQFLQKFQRLRTDEIHYFGEYLSQGALKIEGKCKSVSLKAMLACNLGSLSEHFTTAAQGDNKWVKPVLERREQLSGPESLQQRIATMRTAIKISQLFGHTWQLPVAINLLALLPGLLNAISIENRLLGELSLDETELDELDRTPSIPHYEMAEVMRAEQIRRIVYAGRQERRIIALLLKAESSIHHASTAFIQIQDEFHKSAVLRQSRFISRVAEIALAAGELRDLMETHSRV